MPDYALVFSKAIPPLEVSKDFPVGAFWDVRLGLVVVVIVVDVVASLLLLLLLLLLFLNFLNFYLRQMNEVNGGDNVFVRCVCVWVCLSVRSGRSWELNANSSKTVKTTDFKFDTHVPRDSPDIITKNFPKRGRGHGHVTP